MLRCEICNSKDIKFATSHTTVKQYGVLPDGTIDKNNVIKEYVAIQEDYAICGKCGTKLAASTDNNKITAIWKKAYYR